MMQPHSRISGMKKYEEEDNEVLFATGYVIIIAGTVILLLGVITNIVNLLQAVVAPKWFVVEKFMEMI